MSHATDAVRLVTTRDGAVRFEVQARPHARETGVAGARNGALVVRLAARPVHGAANAELVVTLAAALGIAKRNVELVHGEGSRAKVVEVRGLGVDEVRARLAAAGAC
jgi:uncharacterized protein YggU (UPF0235/DUF167 family)